MAVIGLNLLNFKLRVIDLENRAFAIQTWLNRVSETSGEQRYLASLCCVIFIL